MIKTLKNLFIIGLLGLALVGCEESSDAALEDLNWENFTQPSETYALTTDGNSHKLDDLGTRSEADLREIGAGDIKDVADYKAINLGTKDGYLVKIVAAEGINLEGYVITGEGSEATGLAIDMSKVMADSANEALTIGSEIGILQFFNPEDTEMATVIGQFSLVL